MQIILIGMRQFHFCALVLVSLVPLAASAPFSAHAQEPVTQAAEPDQTPPKDPVGNLFNSLKKERDAKKARVLATEIIGEWRDSGSATINLLMKWAEEASEEKRTAAAYDFLDQAIFLDPDYAGAWYRRAMIHVTDGDVRKAMVDLNQTLEKEPRFFPALAGLANILESSERNEQALKVWQQYLTLYPADKEAQKEMSDLSEKLAGTRS